ncbi:hypothetical protein H1Q59_00960 [Holosporaceae bacterium 'Namur']|nr:hypothetical protein [Holosporaceae bacterium 'Namur']
MARSLLLSKEVEEQSHKLEEKEEAVESFRKRSFRQIVQDYRKSRIEKVTDDSSPENNNKGKNAKLIMKLKTLNKVKTLEIQLIEINNLLLYRDLKRLP